MNTLIIPCAGKSSRFPNMKPKWLLTFPDGKLMIEKAIEGLNLDLFERIIITIVKKHDIDYEASLVLSQVFKNNKKVEICVLDDFTKSASETIYTTLKKMNVSGSFVVKDSDNYVKIDIESNFKNFIASYNIENAREINNISNKSFLLCNKQNIIEDIVEKKIASNIICVGVYAFEDTEIFSKAYCELTSKNVSGEMYVSHIISYLLSTKGHVFTNKEVRCYQDWGTIKEWLYTQKKYRTYFVDVDGVLIKNSGRYGSINWDNNRELLTENVALIKELQNSGAQIIVTTSRTEEFREKLINILNKNNIFPYAVIMGLNHSTRVVINDFASTNPYPSGIAINIPRNGNLNEFINNWRYL